MPRQHREQSRPDPQAAFRAALITAKEAETASHQHAWEAAVLATLVVHANGDQAEAKYLILGRLDEEDLQRSDHRHIYRAVRSLINAGDGVDRSTLKDWLQTHRVQVADADVDAVFEQDAVRDLQLLETYLQRLTNRGRFKIARAHVAAICRTLEQAEAAADAGCLDDLVGQVQAVAFDLGRTRRLIGTVQNEAEALDGFLADLRQQESHKGFVGLDTGFGHLNQLLNGLGQGFYVLAAPPSSGKTSYLKQLADQVAERESVPVLFFSFEEPAKTLRIRTLARLARVNTRDIEKGRTDRTVILDLGDGEPMTVPVADLVEDAAVKYRSFGRHMTLIEADRETTVGRVRLLAQAARQRAQGSRVLVVVDYLQVVPVASPHDYSGDKDRVDWLCSELRRLARDLDSPVVAISSENREAYRDNKRPTMAAFKESGGIEYSADVAAALWTDASATKQYQQQGTPERPDHRRAVSLILLKNRHGELGEVRMTYQPEFATFTEEDRRAAAYADSLGGRRDE